MNEAGEFELVPLEGGGSSLRSKLNHETFHPVLGPRAEAEVLYVRQQQLVARSTVLSKMVLWDVGLGAAANALTAIEALELEADGAQIEILSFDRSTAPLEFALAQTGSLGYLLGHQDRLRTLLRDGEVRISPRIHWKLRVGDFAKTVRDPGLPAPHAIFYDPYAPSGNPEMWTLEHFRRLRSRLDPGTPCLLSNYTRSTAVRVTLLLAGFFVGAGCRIGEKEETTVASNRLELLERPLGARWLERVRASGLSAPLRERGGPGSAISPADWKALRESGQFLT